MLLLSTLAALPLLSNPGFLNTRAGGDSPFLLFRLHQLMAALAAGQFPPRWMPDAAFGLGYPFFNYYASLPYYLAAAFKWYGFSYVAALKLTHLAGFLLTGWAMYAWTARAGLRPRAALVASAAYTFAPFHLANVYVRGDSLSEFWAFALYPLILWAALRLRQSPSAPRAVGLAAAYAALLLDHNISALIFTPFLGLYLVWLRGDERGKTTDDRRPTTDARDERPLRATKDEGSTTEDRGPKTEDRPSSRVAVLRPSFRAAVRRLAKRSIVLRVGRSSVVGRSSFIVHRPAPRSFVVLSTSAVLLGLGLAAFFWVPALAETRYVQLGEQATGYFHFANHFRAADLVQPGFFFNFDPTAGPSPFAMGVVQTVLVALGFLSLFRPRSSVFGHRSFIAVGFLLSTFMITPLSRPLWERLPLLPLVQFPWRFLSVQSVFAAALMGRWSLALGRWLLVAGRWWRAVVRRPSSVRGHRSSVVLRRSSVLLTLLLILLPVTRLRLDFMPVADADVTAERLQLHEYFTGNIGTTIRAEYLPQAALPRPYTSDEFLRREPRVKALSGEAEGTRLSGSAAGQVWRINVTSESARLAIPLLYFPGWAASANGQPVPLDAAPGLGSVAFDLPRGEHTLDFRFGRTPLRALAEGISLASALGAVALVTMRRRTTWTDDRRPTTDEEPLRGTRGDGPLRGTKAGVLRWSLVVRRAQRSSLLGPRSSVVRRPSSVVVLILLIAGPFVLRRLPVASTSGPLNADFDRQAFFHRAPILLADGRTIMAFAPESDRAGIGQRLRLKWQSTGSAPAAFDLSLPPFAESLTGAPASQSQLVAAQPAVPASLAPGAYFFTGLSESSALTATGEPRGEVFAAPLWVDGESASAAGTLGEFGPAIRLASVEVRQRACGVEVRPTWNATGDVPENYAIALRLRDAAGDEWAALDVAAASPFYPSGLWRPGEFVPDRYCLDVPAGLPISDEYRLSLTLYRASTLDPVGSVEVPASLTQASPVPAGLSAPTPFAPGLALAGVDWPPSATPGDTLRLAARWVVTGRLDANLRAEWSLTPQASGDPVLLVAELAPGSPPDRWPAGSYVLGRTNWRLPAQLPAGDYALGLRLRRADGAPVGDRVALGTIEIAARHRTFDLPPMAVSLGVEFGETIRLWGYDLSRSGDGVELTLHWGALSAPAADYKFFVHLFDPATETIVAQADAMPRDYTYPTSQWVEGEVVSDRVRLSLEGVPAGEYRLAVGWYDPASPTLERLPAFGADGAPLPGDRAVLPDTVRAPRP